MLKSSSEYLQALRDGNYLLFLEWPRFIVEHYKSTEDFSAENIVDLLLFDWLNNGYTEQDAKLVALLFRVNELRPNPLSPDLSYAVVTISVVVLQCMAYESTSSLHKCLSSSMRSAQEVIDFMSLNTIESLEKVISEQEEKFFKLVNAASDAVIDKIIAKISPLLQIRRDAQNYLDDLEKSNVIKHSVSDSSLDISRLSVVRRLVQYLKGEAELTEAVDRKIKEYVALIRELSPQPFEEEFLIRLAPPTMADNTWRLIARVGYFFSSIALPQEPSSEVGIKPKVL